MVDWGTTPSIYQAASCRTNATRLSAGAAPCVRAVGLAANFSHSGTKSWQHHLSIQINSKLESHQCHLPPPSYLARSAYRL